MDSYEIECTKQFEGIYSEKEAKLNNLLLEACIKEVINCAEIEKLLDQGADPLGTTATTGWGAFKPRFRRDCHSFF